MMELERQEDKRVEVKKRGSGRKLGVSLGTGTDQRYTKTPWKDAHELAC